MVFSGCLQLTFKKFLNGFKKKQQWYKVVQKYARFFFPSLEVYDKPVLNCQCMFPLQVATP